MKRVAWAALCAAGLMLLSGCGSQGAGLPVGPALTLADGRAVAQFGFGAEGGAQPSLVARAGGGFALAYVGTRPRDRHVYLATSSDGQSWTRPVAVAVGEFSDQSPALLEDKAGTLHLYFVSNRSGLHQAVYHCTLQGTMASEPHLVPGLQGAQRLALTRLGTEVVLVAEVMGAGIVAYQGEPGGALVSLAPVAEAGAEPAICALPDGRVAVAFQQEGKIVLREGVPGEWGAEMVAASASVRLRDPALLAKSQGGVLAYAERQGVGNTQIKLRAFDENFQFRAMEKPGIGPGEARGANFAVSLQGLRLLAWGMKTVDGQQGVMVTTH